jgi:hypothetical protein
LRFGLLLILRVVARSEAELFYFAIAAHPILGNEVPIKARSASKGNVFNPSLALRAAVDFTSGGTKRSRVVLFCYRCLSALGVARKWKSW